MVSSMRNLVNHYFLFLDVPVLKLGIIIIILPNDRPKSDFHVSENFCQIKIFPCPVRKNTIVCLFGF